MPVIFFLQCPHQAALIDGFKTLSHNPPLNNPFKIIEEREADVKAKERSRKLRKEKPGRKHRKKEKVRKSDNGIIYRFNC